MNVKYSIMNHLKISIVTVCYNMAPYIEQTMLSVLNQNYPNLEYIVIDGGSTDGTQDIIEKYRDRLAYYISEPDNGMYDAINKGFKHATGDIVAWINADDIYMPWTLRVVNQAFSTFEDINWISGKHAFLTESGVLAHVFPKCAIKTQKDIYNGWCRHELIGNLMQESMFWRKSLMDKAGMLDISFRLAGDFELWTRFAKYSPLTVVDVPLAAFRRRKGGLSIGQTEKYNAEVDRVLVGKPRYPNLFWKYGHKKPLFRQLLRLLRFSKGDILYYLPKNDELHRKQFLGSSSTQCIETLRMYK